VLIPEGGDVLADVVNALKAQGVPLSNKRLLGSAQWDEGDVLQIKELHGAFVSSPDLSKRRPFEAQFKTTYQSTPPKIASLAYDAVAMMAALYKHFPQDPYNPTSLIQGRGFLGVDGVFRLRSDGRCERKLAILKLTPQGFVNIEGGGRTF
jgi:branched-chain amino acid transport system substrate-binding protein